MRWLGCLGAGGCWCLWSRACRRNQAGSGSFRWQGRCVRRSRLGRRGGSAAPRRLRDTGILRWFATLGDGGTGHRALRSCHARSAAWWSPAASAILASSRPRRVAGSPLASSRGTQVAERQTQQRLQLIGPASSTDPVPARTSRAVSTVACASRTWPPAAQILARSSSARNSKTGRPLRYRQRLPGELLGGTGLAPLQREASQRAQVLDGKKVLAESRPPRLRISGTGGISPVSRPRTRPAPAHRAHAPA